MPQPDARGRPRSWGTRNFVGIGFHGRHAIPLAEGQRARDCPYGAVSRFDRTRAPVSESMFLFLLFLLLEVIPREYGELVDDCRVDLFLRESDRGQVPIRQTLLWLVLLPLFVMNTSEVRSL